MDKDRYPLAQQTVLGAMLIDPECIGSVFSELSPTDFDEGPLRTTFVAIQSLFAAGKPVDGITVADAAGWSEDKEKRSFLAQLMEITPTSANVMEYVRIVKKQGRLSRLRALGVELAQANDAEGAAGLVEKINMASTSQKTTKSHDMNELLNEFYDAQEKKAGHILTGFAELDHGIYISPGDFVVIGGFPSDGKTCLSIQMAYEMSVKERTGYFSLETSPKKLFERLVSMATITPFSAIKRQELDENDFRKIIAHNEDIQSRNLEIVSAAGWSAGDIAAFSRSRKYSSIFVDYLQLLHSPEKSRYEQVTSISMNLHEFAQASGTTVFALSQFSRETKGTDRRERPPRISDLRESGAIEQDADIILLLYRQDAEDPNSQRILRVAKNKEGTVGQFIADFNGKYQTFNIIK